MPMHSQRAVFCLVLVVVWRPSRARAWVGIYAESLWGETNRGHLSWSRNRGTCPGAALGSITTEGCLCS
jgi:hypothetical protein